MTRGEDQRLSLFQDDHVAPRLCPRPLLNQQAFAAGIVSPAPAQDAGELERERHRAVQVLVQAVVAPRPVLEEQRRRLGLAVLGADGEKPFEILRVRLPSTTQGRIPPIGDGGQPRIRLGAEGGDQPGERLGEVLVLSETEAIARHVDAATEPAVIGVEVDQVTALLGRQERRRPRPARVPERPFDGLPVQAREPLSDGAGRAQAAAEGLHTLQGR